jgi:DNA polymerase I
MATDKRSGYIFCAPDLQTIKLVPPRIAYKLNYEFITNEDHLIQVMALLKDVEWVAIDTETTSLNYDKLDLIAISFAFNNKSYCIVIKHNTKVSEISNDFLKGFLEYLFTKKIFMFNVRYDLRVLYKFFPVLKSIEAYIIDVQALVFIADSNISLPSLKASSLSFLGIKQPEFKKEWLGENIKFSDFYEFIFYASFDANNTLELGNLFFPELNQKYKSVVEIYRRLIKPIMSFEDIEMTIDYPYLEEMSKQINDRRDKLKELIWEQLGVFNIASNVQLRKKLELAGLDTKVKTETGQMSTGIKALPNLKGIKFVDWLIEHSKLGKLQSTYVDNMLLRKYYDLPVKFAYRLYNVPSGRLAAGTHEKLTKKFKNTSCFIDMNIQSVVQPGTVNRRLNYNPDTYEIKWDDDGQYCVEVGKPILNFRKSFIPFSKDYVWLSTDFSSQEMVVAANLSGEPVWLEAFKNHEDLHMATAFKMWGKENYNKEKRKLAKGLNFGMMYKGNAYTIQTNFKVSEKEAMDLYNTYTNALPVYYKKWCPQVERLARRQGYIVNAYGFPRKLQWYYRMGGGKAMYAERSVANHLIQGFCAVVIELAMIKLFALTEKKYKDTAIFQSTVHDEVNYLVRKDVVIEFAKDQNRIMTHLTPKDFVIPLEVQNSIGENWGEIFKVKMIEDKFYPVESDCDNCSSKACKNRVV